MKGVLFLFVEGIIKGKNKKDAFGGKMCYNDNKLCSK